MEKRARAKRINSKDDADRFWPKVDKTPGHGPKGDCWVWTAGLDNHGYGCFHPNGCKSIKAHRMAWQLANRRKLEPYEKACHSCDNPPCCNPSHIFIGTQADNVADRHAKGRTRTHNSKLRPEEVIKIHLLHNSGMNSKDIAEQFEIDFSMVRKILHGDNWKQFAYLTDPKTLRPRMRIDDYGYTAESVTELKQLVSGIYNKPSG